MDYDSIISRMCPQCKNEMVNVDYKFKPPKKDDIKKWEVMKNLGASPEVSKISP
jgi:hypothetical protein